MNTVRAINLAEADQDEVDTAISKLLREQSYSPAELFELEVRDWNNPGRAERDLLYAKLRMTLSHALELATPANFEAVGRAAIECLRRAMDESARDFLRGAE